MLCRYAAESRDMPYVHITAAEEDYLAQRVFAQFVYAQTLKFNRSARITELTVPMHLPDHAMPIKIRLFQDGKPVYSWIFPRDEKQSGVVEAHLQFATPTLLERNMEVMFDGSAIDHDHQDFAPGLFIEPKNEGYRGGNYRIASNEKSGDISLGFTETKIKYEIFMERFGNNPIGSIAFLLLVLAGVFTIGLFPSIMARLFVRKER